VAKSHLGFQLIALENNTIASGLYAGPEETSRAQTLSIPAAEISLSEILFAHTRDEIIRKKNRRPEGAGFCG
jgi:hypothetical protein